MKNKIDRNASRAELLREGERICASLSREELVAWAGQVLEAASALCEPVSEVKAIVDATKDRSQWSSCMPLFSATRALLLRAERGSTDRATICLLYLAENVAKVTYNASDGPAPFDAEAGAWILDCAVRLLGALSDRSRGASLEALLGVRIDETAPFSG